MSIITLLTDFGSGSPYPAEMKGVLVCLCRATLVDITHEVPAHDIACGAYLLAAAAPAFPAGTIHLAVVDPGVGTARQALAVAAGGHVFIGPDNGLLMAAAHALGGPRAFAIDAERFARRPLSATFHGRDLFAPAAAALAEGLPVEQIGSPAAAPVELTGIPAERSPGALRGHVLYRDSFGNLITNIPGVWMMALAGLVTLEHPRGRAALRIVSAYADGKPGEPLMLIGSSGTVEIAVNAGSAAEVLGLRAGDIVAVLTKSQR